MNIDIHAVVEAHGGEERWKKYSSLQADLVVGGGLWGLKQQAGVLDKTGVTVGIGDEWASHHPFGLGDRRSRFTPNRVVIEDADGLLVDQLDQPRSSFAGHVLETPWSETQLAYFAGYAMWTYFNLPFLALRDDISIEPLPAWDEAGETWHPLRLTFPAGIATHSRVQTIYAGADGLLRRHDYSVDIAGGAPGAHYISRYKTVEGLAFPTRRRVYGVDADNAPLPDIMTVSIDLSNIRLVSS